MVQHIGAKRNQIKLSYLKNRAISIVPQYSPARTTGCKVQELEELNQALRNHDKMKDDAVAQLSDQVMALTARMQEFELKQQPYMS